MYIFLSYASVTVQWKDLHLTQAIMKIEKVEFDQLKTLNRTKLHMSVV